MIKRIELLVHAGAPSKRGDDDRYRAQAEAYASFDAALKLPINHDTSPECSNESHAEHANAISNATGANATGANAPQLYLDDTRLAYTALDSQLLTSSLRCSQPNQTSEKTHVHEYRPIVSAKRKRDADLSEALEIHHPDSSANAENGSKVNANAGLRTHESATDAKESTTSSYLKSPELNRANKKTKLDVRRKRNSSEPIVLDREKVVLSMPVVDQRTELAKGPVEDLAERTEDSVGGNQSTSELPTSYSLSDITSGSSRARPNISQRSISDPGPQIGSISPTALRVVPTPRKYVPANAVRQPGIFEHHYHRDQTGEDGERSGVASTAHPASKRSPSSRHNVAGQPASVMTGNAPNSSLKRKKKDKCQSVNAATSDLDALRRLSVSIQPQEPDVAVAEFSTHVTEMLRHLVEDTDLVPAYRPVSVSRELRPLERGHWLIKSPESSELWPLSDQIAFWTWLDRRIAQGHAGWGVWCTREQGVHDTNAGPSSLGVVKVFCWGEIVRHVYLLLYLASHSRVRKLGLQWVDAEGEVVVQMREG